jgi:hypothetical protein
VNGSAVVMTIIGDVGGGGGERETAKKVFFFVCAIENLS